MEFVKTLLVVFAVFMAIDLLYLGVIAKSFVRKQLGHLMGDTNWPAAVIFYIQYCIGLIYFVIDPALSIGEPTDALVNGALFGFFLYATYELTSYAILKNWPKGFVIPDILWGIFLSSSVSYISYIILAKL